MSRSDRALEAVRIAARARRGEAFARWHRSALPLNSALYVVALSRARHHQPTRDYIERRRAEGRTDREIRRCLKRDIARHVWRLLEHPPTAEIPT